MPRTTTPTATYSHARAPAPNQSSSTTYVTTTFAYDPLNRLRTKTYSDGTTATVTLDYDETSVSGNTLLNTIGRLSLRNTPAPSTAMTSQSILSYNAPGWVATDIQCTPQNCANNTRFTFGYGYDDVGDVTTSSNGNGIPIHLVLQHRPTPSSADCNQLAELHHQQRQSHLCGSVQLFRSAVIRKPLQQRQRDLGLRRARTHAVLHREGLLHHEIQRQRHHLLGQQQHPERHRHRQRHLVELHLRRLQPGSTGSTCTANVSRKRETASHSVMSTTATATAGSRM